MPTSDTQLLLVADRADHATELRPQRLKSFERLAFDGPHVLLRLTDLRREQEAQCDARVGRPHKVQHQRDGRVCHFDRRPAKTDDMR
eukprot:6035647-Pyramimonas_sp.AAC.1